MINIDFTNLILNIINTNRLPVIKKQNGLYYHCTKCAVTPLSTDEVTGTVTLKFTLVSSDGLVVTGTFNSNNGDVLNWIRSNEEAMIK